jgi:hypothetical protein
VEAEVGPIKYIAKLIYGDNPDANILEKAVTWVIMIIVFVFDPLAVLMLLGAQMTYKWHKEQEQEKEEYLEMASDLYEVSAANNTTWLDEQAEELTEAFNKDPKKEQDDPHPVGWMFPKHATIQEYRVEDADEEQAPEEVVEPVVWEGIDHTRLSSDSDLPEDEEPFDFDIEEYARSYSTEEADEIKRRMREWKEANPNSTIKEQRTRYEMGLIDRLPWEEESQVPEKKTYIVKDGAQQVVKTRDDTYIQNAEQNTETLWQKIQNKKAK